MVGPSLKSSSGRHHLALWLGAITIVVPLLSLAPYFSSGTEIARARNSLVLDATADASVDWSPANVPPDFLVDQVAPYPVFSDVAQLLGLSEFPTD